MDGLGFDTAPPSAVLGERTPAAIAFAARVFAGGAPSLETGFTYLDLGCGPGMNTAVLAEVYRQGRFYGLDPDKANIEKASTLKELFWIENAEFHQCALTDVLSKDLPKFDFVSLTGAYTMLSTESQSKVRALLGDLLKPDGAVLVRYPSNPGNMPFSVMNVWGKLLIARNRGTEREKTQSAFPVMRDLADKDSILHEILPTSSSVIEDAAKRDPAYMSLYFQSEGDGMWFHDIAEHMGAAGLTHAGSTRPELNLMRETAEKTMASRLVEMDTAYGDPVLEQELISALTLVPSRADVFCKPADRHGPSLEGVQDYYIQPVYSGDPASLLAEVQKTTVIDLSQSIYPDCLRAIDFFGDRVSYFQRKCPAAHAASDWERTILHLICLRVVQISPHPLKSIEDETVRYGQNFTVSKLVRSILTSQVGLNELVNLPAPATGTTVVLNQLTRLLCLAVIEGSLEAIWPLCMERGFYPRTPPSGNTGAESTVTGGSGTGSRETGGTAADERVRSEAEFVKAHAPFLREFRTAVLPGLVRQGLISVI